MESFMEEMPLRVRFGLGGQGVACLWCKGALQWPRWQVGSVPQDEGAIPFGHLSCWQTGGWEGWNLTPGGKKLELRVFSKGCCLRGCDLKQLPLTLTWCDSWGKKFFIFWDPEVAWNRECPFFFTRKFPRALLLLSNLSCFSYFCETCCFQPLWCMILFHLSNRV